MRDLGQAAKPIVTLTFTSSPPPIHTMSHSWRSRRKMAPATVISTLLLVVAAIALLCSSGASARSIVSSSSTRLHYNLERQGNPPPGVTDPNVPFSTLSRDKWIGLGLAISSSLAIGTSFIITKKGLMDAAERGSGMASDDHAYLGNPIWWAGMSTMIVGEVANFAAYTFAPPILVTPLGALSVLIGAILASFILKEELGRLGRVGCGLCLVGTVIIIMNAPEDKEIRTVDEMLNYAIQMREYMRASGILPSQCDYGEITRAVVAFLTYCLFVTGFAIFMIWHVVPRYGKRTPLVYISICSLVGSISVMSVKGFGVALKLTLDGNNQFTHPSTYCFALVVIVCILVQMNYFNKALDQFSTNIVNPIYYVLFTTSTIFASVLLFRGFNTEGAGPAISLLGGFIVIFMGVYLLNLNRLIDPVTQQPRVSFMTGEGLAGTGRLSEHHERLLGETGIYHHRQGSTGGGGGRGSLSYPPRRTTTPSRRDSTNSSLLFGGYEDLEESVGLTQLNEESFEDDGGRYSDKTKSPRRGAKGLHHQSHSRSHSLVESPPNSYSHHIDRAVADTDTDNGSHLTRR